MLEPLALRGQMAAELRDRPAGEPLDVALGHAVVALLATPRAGVQRLRQLTTVVEGAETLQVRLLEEFRRERSGLEVAVAARLGRPVDDLHCVATARLATLVLELVSDRLGSLPDDPAAVEEQLLAITRDVMAGLQAEPPVLPRYEGRGRFFGLRDPGPGRVRSAATPVSTQVARSSSEATSAAGTTTMLRITRPVMSISRAPRSIAAAKPALPTRTSRSSPTHPHGMPAPVTKARPPNIFRSSNAASRSPSTSRTRAASPSSYAMGAACPTPPTGRRGPRWVRSDGVGRTLEIETPDGPAEAWLARARRRRPHPGVLLHADAIGLRPQIEEMADRIAGWGYVVLAPNPFFRDGRAADLAPSADLRVPANREAFFAGAMARVRALTPALSDADADAWLAALGEHAPGPVGVTGYCFGARLATRTACRHPDRGRGLRRVARRRAGRRRRPRQPAPAAAARPGGVRLRPRRPRPLDAARGGGAARRGAHRGRAGAPQRGVRRGAAHGYTMADAAPYDEAADGAPLSSRLRDLLDRTLR